MQEDINKPREGGEGGKASREEGGEGGVKKLRELEITIGVSGISEALHLAILALSTKVGEVLSINYNDRDLANKEYISLKDDGTFIINFRLGDIKKSVETIVDVAYATEKNVGMIFNGVEVIARPELILSDPSSRDHYVSSLIEQYNEKFDSIRQIGKK